MSYYNQSYSSNKSIDTVQLIKILYQSINPGLNYGLSSTDFAKQTGFVCLVTYADRTKQIDIVSLDDMNKKYTQYLNPIDLNTL